MSIPGRMVPNRFRIVLLVGVLCVASFAKDKHAEGSLTVELSAPFETATEIVSEVAADGIIRGTGQYTTEQQISGSLPAQDSKLLEPEVPPGAAVFFKVRTGAIAPRHYNGSTDVGTLVVAYTVEKVASDKSRLTIESIFVPDSHHGRKTSDGSVETCEFTAIETKLQELEKLRKETQEKKDREQQEVRIRTLRRELAEQQNRYDALNAEVQQLHKRSTELRQLSVVKSKSSSARLKASPYTRAGTVESLTEGEELQVLYRTPTWYYVRTNAGRAGWVYYSLLEPVQ